MAYAKLSGALLVRKGAPIAETVSVPRLATPGPSVREGDGLLARHLKSLNLPTFLSQYQRLAQQYATEGLDPSGYLLRLQRRLAGYKLLIIDELAYVPLSTAGAELLFDIISQRYERGSTVITSNLPLDEWTKAFGSQQLTSAMLDRLTHHVHILDMQAENYRSRQGKRGNGSGRAPGVGSR